MKTFLIFIMSILLSGALSSQDTIVRSYWENGALKEVMSFRDEKPWGTFTNFSPRGAKIAEAHYIDGLKHGNWQIWSPGGTLLFDMHYEMGERVGVWKMWDESGELLSYREF